MIIITGLAAEDRTVRSIIPLQIAPQWNKTWYTLPCHARSCICTFYQGIWLENISVFLRRFLRIPKLRSQTEASMSRPSQTESANVQTFVRSPDFRAFLSRLLCVHKTFVRSCPVFSAFTRVCCVQATFVRSCSYFHAFPRLICVHQVFVRSCPDFFCIHQTRVWWTIFCPFKFRRLKSRLNQTQSAWEISGVHIV